MPGTRQALRRASPKLVAAHVRRRFFELQVSTKSVVAEQARKFFGELYEIEREVRGLTADQLLPIPNTGQARGRCTARLDDRAPPARHRRHGTALARALDYSLKRRTALTRSIEDSYTLILDGWANCNALEERDLAIFEDILASNPHVSVRST